MIISITNENFKKEITDETKPIILDLYASWCGPCQQMKPIFKDLENELSTKYKFAEHNVDESDDRKIPIQYGVTSIPTFIFIKNGQVVGKELGYISKDDLREKIEKYLG